MDKTTLRQQALNIATMKAKAEATVSDIIADAEEVLAWLSADFAPPPAPAAAPITADQHESAKAV